MAELESIDECELAMQAGLVGYGPTLFVGLSKRADVKLVRRLELGSGVAAMRFEPDRQPSARERTSGTANSTPTVLE